MVQRMWYQKCISIFITELSKKKILLNYKLAFSVHIFKALRLVVLSYRPFSFTKLATVVSYSVRTMHFSDI